MDLRPASPDGKLHAVTYDSTAEMKQVESGLPVLQRATRSLSRLGREGIGIFPRESYLSRRQLGHIVCRGVAEDREVTLEQWFQVASYLRDQIVDREVSTGQSMVDRHAARLSAPQE
jgi:hypothetical protein